MLVAIHVMSSRRRRHSPHNAALAQCDRNVYSRTICLPNSLPYRSATSGKKRFSLTSTLAHPPSHHTCTLKNAPYFPSFPPYICRHNRPLTSGPFPSQSDACSAGSRKLHPVYRRNPILETSRLRRQKHSRRYDCLISGQVFSGVSCASSPATDYDAIRLRYTAKFSKQSSKMKST